MTTSIQVLQYIKSAMPHVNNTQAMKLLYYTQGWSLTWTGEEAFSDPVIAWQFGPAVLSAYQAFPHVQPRRDCVNPGVRTIVDAVIGHYGHMSAANLRDLSHSESPWIKAFNAPDGGHEARKPISATDMKKEFTMQSIKGQGPTKPMTAGRIMEKSKFDKLLGRIRSEDREALDALASR